MGGKFSLYEQIEVTNSELVITYKPSTSIVKYTYKVYNKNKVISEITVSSNKMSSIHLTESGTYKIEVVTLDKNKKQAKETSGIYNLDLDKPVIVVEDNILNMEALKKNETLTMEDLRGTIKVVDKQDGDLFNKLSCNLDDINFSKIGLYDLKCSVTDNAGNKTDSVIKFNITKSNNQAIHMAQISIIAILFITIFLIGRYIKAINLEKRIVKYSVVPIKDNKMSTFDRAKLMFQDVISRFSKVLRKSVFMTKHAKKYDKYAPLYHYLYKDSIEFVSLKFILAFLFIIITLFSKTIQLKMLSFDEVLIPFIFGFYLPDIIYLIRYKIYRNRLENDLLQAIIIMNNAFKSGRSIIQAIELVTHELKGPISEEFKKMHLELSFGLSIEHVFKRFSDRIKLEEVTYLTASLSILNKTGGNIIKVFSSIEKSLFNKKKLKLEMMSLTGSSKIIIWILSLVPFLFITFISLISPDYFTPFYTNPIGFILMGIMILIYLLYIWTVRKIMKVRM